MYLVESWGIILLAGKVSISHKVDMRIHAEAEPRELVEWPAVWISVGLQKGEMAHQKKPWWHPREQAACEAESESTTWPRRGRGQKPLTINTWTAALKAPFKQLNVISTWQGLPTLCKRVQMKRVAERAHRPLVAHGSGGPRSESQSQYCGRPVQAPGGSPVICAGRTWMQGRKLLKSGSLQRAGQLQI